MSVFIVGAPTAGKSTLARVIKDNFTNSNVFSFEAMRNGFIKSLPSLKMDYRNSAARREILPEFIVEFASWNEKITSNLFVVEGAFASVEVLAGLIEREDIIICLGYGGKCKEDIAKIALERVTRNNYLYGCTMDNFLSHFYDIDECDQKDMDFCNRNGLPYFNVSQDRDVITEEVLELLRMMMRDDER